MNEIMHLEDATYLGLLEDVPDVVEIFVNNTADQILKGVLRYIEKDFPDKEIASSVLDAAKVFIVNAVREVYAFSAGESCAIQTGYIRLNHDACRIILTNPSIRPKVITFNSFRLKSRMEA